MDEKRTSHARYCFDCAEGTQVRGWVLYGEGGEWLGDAALEYNAEHHRLRLYIVSDFGNYCCRWDGAGANGYWAFLKYAGNGYITDKLAQGHNEQRELLVKETQKAIWEVFSKGYKAEDADYLGDAHSDLLGCECEADFFTWAEENGHADVYEQFEYGWGGCLPGLYERLLPELKRVLEREARYGYNEE